MAQKWHQKASVQVAIVSGVFALIITVMTIWHQRSDLHRVNERMKSQIVEFEQKINEDAAEIMRLETLLTPFRTIALERYPGTDREALKRLAENLETLKSKAKRLEMMSATDRITSEQEDIIINELRKHEPSTIQIEVNPLDVEACALAQSFKYAIEAGGWKVTEIEPMIYLDPMFGIFTTTDPNNPSKQVQALNTALKAAGFQPQHIGHSKNEEIDDIILIVGEKERK